MGLGLIPHFALGSIPDVSSSASTGGDSLVLGVNDMDGRLDVRGSEIRDVGVTSSSRGVNVRMTGSETSGGVRDTNRSATARGIPWEWKGSLTSLQERVQCRQCPRSG